MAKAMRRRDIEVGTMKPMGPEEVRAAMGWLGILGGVVLACLMDYLVDQEGKEGGEAPMVPRIPRAMTPVDSKDFKEFNEKLLNAMKGVDHGVKVVR